MPFVSTVLKIEVQRVHLIQQQKPSLSKTLASPSLYKNRIIAAKAG